MNSIYAIETVELTLLQVHDRQCISAYVITLFRENVLGKMLYDYFPF